MAWIGFALEDAARSVHPVAQYGFETSYLEQARISWDDNELGRGPTGTAVRQGIIQVNQNFRTNPKTEPWRESALARGYQASIALPLQSEGASIAVLTIYSAIPDAFDDEEVQLLSELANNLAFGITALRVRVERQQAEELNRRLSSIVEQTEDTVVVTNHRGIIEYVNPAFERLTGYTSQELIGKTPRMIKSGLHNDEYYEDMWATILRGDVFQNEIANRKKDGEIFYEIKTISPLRDAQGRITHFVATGKDITERKEIEGQMLIQTAAIKAAANGIVITDRQGNIQWTNPALTQISGYSLDELFGQSMRIFQSGQQDPSYYQRMWNIILSGEVWRGEITNRRKDGSCYIEEQIITPVQGIDHQITHFIAIKQDISARKQAEKELQERNQKEKILTETIRTMQLDIARDLHDTIGQNISFLRMKLDYLTEKKIRRQKEMQVELKIMARAANESYDLMRGTLAMLQSENSADLSRLFTRYAEQIEERSCVKVDFSSQGEPKFMSARRMRQLFYIFREILSNIEKHAQARQVSIQMTWSRDCLSLTVCDDGSGFDPDQIQYGSHYGLKFMKERVELLNGSLTIGSELGAGTKIILQVPYE